MSLALGAFPALLPRRVTLYACNPGTESNLTTAIMQLDCVCVAFECLKDKRPQSEVCDETWYLQLHIVWWKMSRNLSWEILGTFDLHVLRKEKHQNSTRNLTAFSTVPSMRDFHRTKSAIPAKTKCLGKTNRNSAITQLESAARPPLTTGIDVQVLGHPLFGPRRHRSPWVQPAQPSDQDKDLCRRPCGEHRAIKPTRNRCVVVSSLAHVAHGKWFNPALGFVRRWDLQSHIKPRRRLVGRDAIPFDLWLRWLVWKDTNSFVPLAWENAIPFDCWLRGRNRDF